MCVLSSAAESKLFQSRSKAEISGLAKREEYAFLSYSDAELLMYY